MFKTEICCFLFCIISFSIAQGLSVNECSQGGLVPEEVVIDGCEPNETICQVTFNGLFSMTMKFKAPHYLESMKPTLTGKTVLGTTTFRGGASNDDVCSGILNTYCPLVEKEVIEYKYSAKLLVLPWLPLSLEFSILDTELNETAVCFTMAVIPSKL